MPERFVISDTHFGHTNSWEKFKLADGCTPLRPFTSTEEMDETMIDNWNRVVSPNSKVYHLGDVVINKKYLHLISRLNGKKRLIRGNHDIFTDTDYRNAGFEQIWGVKVFDKFIMSHIPLHPESITSRFRVNVHGHYHANRVMQPRGFNVKTGEVLYSDKPDPRYLCVCVEQTNFTPLSFDEIEERIQKLWAETGYEGKKGWGNGHGPD